MLSDKTLSAICSRTRKWFPAVVGKRYILDRAPPNTDRNTDQLIVSTVYIHVCTLSYYGNIPTNVRIIGLLVVVHGEKTKTWKQIIEFLVAGFSCESNVQKHV